MSDTVIEHTGIVVKTDENSTEVLILSKSACASCQVKGTCGASDMSEKIIEVPNAGCFAKGDSVQLSMKLTYGYIAMVYAYVLPFILMLAVLLLATHASSNELVGGLASLAVLVPYYTVLYFQKDRLKNKFRYTLKHSGL